MCRCTVVRFRIAPPAPGERSLPGRPGAHVARLSSEPRPGQIGDTCWALLLREVSTKKCVFPSLL